jgi:hypothetical protein
MMAALQIFVAYLLADALSGFYHLVTDCGLNIASQVALFEEHHQTNTMVGFDWQTFAAAMPIAIVGAWFHSPFAISLACFIALTQVTHYYAHRRSTSPLVHRIVRGLQIARVIVPPQAHARHHQPPHSRDFCLLSGWNNFWLNPLIALFDRKPSRAY